MKAGYMVAFVLIALGSPASAQTNDPARQGIEHLTTIFVENYNKQDAAGVAGTFTKDGVLVQQASSSSGAVRSGTQALVQFYESRFKMGVNHIDSTVTHIEPLGTDAAIVWGEYHITGQGQNGPIKVDGDWSATDVREGDTWKIKLLNVIPKAPAPATR